MKIKELDRVKLKDGREATIMDILGPDYVVDIGESEEEYDTIIIKFDEIEEVLS